jgi:hypothetical protein
MLAESINTWCELQQGVYDQPNRKRLILEVDNNPIGLAAAFKKCLKKFIELSKPEDLAVIIEDDAELNNPLVLDEVLPWLFNSEYKVRLSFRTVNHSSETPFLPENDFWSENILINGPYQAVISKKPFFSICGAFLSNLDAKQIVNLEMHKFSEPENIISKISPWSDHKALILFYDFDAKPQKIFGGHMPSKSHFLADDLRYLRRVKFDGGYSKLDKFINRIGNSFK